jgi:8-oxo-dGTP diphosphatase
VGNVVHQRELFVLPMLNSESVIADERFFLVTVTDPPPLSSAQWSAQERQVVVGHHWWSEDELAQTTATIWPADLSDIIRSVADSIERQNTRAG